MTDEYAPNIRNNKTKYPVSPGDQFTMQSYEIRIVCIKKNAVDPIVQYYYTNAPETTHTTPLSALLYKCNIDQDKAVYYINRKPKQRVRNGQLVYPED